jgi:hypothetical protein
VSGRRELRSESRAETSEDATIEADRAPASENDAVSTRTLLILAALTGLLILVAFALQVVVSR